MVRKSQRLSSGSKATPTHKRAGSNTTLPTAAAKKRKATPTKSRYFEDPEDEDETAGTYEDDAELSSPEDEEASDFGDEDEDLSPSDADDQDEDDSDSDHTPKSRKKTTPKKGGMASATIRMKENELLREGVKTGLGPGTQVVIKKAKARPAGKTPYADETIHPNTLLFLKDLKANNERQWLKSELSLSCQDLCNVQKTLSVADGVSRPHLNPISEWCPNSQPCTTSCTVTTFCNMTFLYARSSSTPSLPLPTHQNFGGRGACWKRMR